MAKTKRKVTAATTRGKAILRSSSVPDDLDHVRSIVLAVQAPSAGLSGSSSSVLHSVHPPLACAVGPAFLPPIPEDPPVPNPLQTASVDDGSEAEDDGLVEALSEEEQLDFSFSDDDGEDLSTSPSLLPPTAGLTPPSASEGRSPPSSVVAGGCVPPTIGVAGSSLASTPGSKTWSDLFPASKPPVPCTKLQNFSLNHLTKSCVISPEDFQPQFDIWNLCAVGYVSGKHPGFKALQGIISSVWKCEASLTIHASGWLIYRFNREEDKSSVLRGGPYLVYGRPLILKPMTKFFYFSSEEMTRAPVWVKFPNLPLCCWSPPCLSKIASVLGKPLQSDHMTSSLSRLSYARVLVELDLREDLQHSVEISLPSSPVLIQKVVYEALPQFCNHCNVIGHTRLLCPKTTVSPPPAGTPLPVAGNGSVFHRLGPQIPPSGVPGHSQPLPVQGPSKASQASCVDASDGWIAVEPRKNFRKHIRSPPKGKEVLVVADVSALSPKRDAPPDYAGVATSIDTEAVVEAGVDLGVTLVPTSQTVPCHQSLALDVQAATGSVFSRLGPQPSPQSSTPLQKLQDRVQPATQAVGSAAANVPSTDWVTVVSRSKSSKQAKGTAVGASPCAEAANG